MIGKLYLGIQIYRFYIKCTKCLAEITFCTNPESQDYEMEKGAIRNFECVRLAEKQAEAEAKHEKEEEANNPMKLLENRTRDSRREMAILESLEDLKELNTKNASYDPMEIVKVQEEYEKQLLKLQVEEDEMEIQRMFCKHKATDDNDEDEDEEEEEEIIVFKKPKIEKEEIVKKQNSKVKPVLNGDKKTIKNNLSLLIRKKETTNDIIKTETKKKEEETKPVHSLANLCAYSDDSDCSNEEN